MNELIIEKFDSKNEDHAKSLKQCMDHGMLEFLGNIFTKEYASQCFYLVKLQEYIGFFAFSNPTETFYGVTTSLYYGVFESFRGNHYGHQILKQAISFIFTHFSVDMIIANVDKNNQFSIRAFENTEFKKNFEDDEDIQFICKR